MHSQVLIKYFDSGGDGKLNAAELQELIPQANDRTAKLPEK